MIDLVRERPILYHPLHEEKDNRTLKRQAFIEIHTILSERFRPFPDDMTGKAQSCKIFEKFILTDSKIFCS